MTDLDSEARTLVELARDGANPTAADRRRVLRGLTGALTTTAALSATAGSAAAATGAATGSLGAAAGSGASVAAWLGAGVLIGLTASTTVVVLTHGSPPPAPRAGAAAPPVAPAEMPRVASAPLTSPRIESPEAPAVEPPARVAAESTVPRAPDAPAADLGAETALLRTAQAALGRGDARAALAALDAHESQFPSGALTEERLGARVFALCSMGRRGDAARAARALLDRAPTSPLRARVLDSCIREP